MLCSFCTNTDVQETAAFMGLGLRRPEQCWKASCRGHYVVKPQEEYEADRGKRVKTSPRELTAQEQVWEGGSYGVSRHDGGMKRRLSGFRKRVMET